MTPLDAWVNTANIQRLRRQMLDPALAPRAGAPAAGSSVSVPEKLKSALSMIYGQRRC